MQGILDRTCQYQTYPGTRRGVGLYRNCTRWSTSTQPPSERWSCRTVYRGYQAQLHNGLNPENYFDSFCGFLAGKYGIWNFTQKISTFHLSYHEKKCKCVKNRFIICFKCFSPFSRFNNIKKKNEKAKIKIDIPFLPWYSWLVVEYLDLCRVEYTDTEQGAG